MSRLTCELHPVQTAKPQCTGCVWAEGLTAGLEAALQAIDDFNERKFAGDNSDLDDVWDVVRALIPREAP